MKSASPSLRLPRSFQFAALAATASALCAAVVGCSASPTPPSSTPVYEDDVVAGAEPLQVEKVSVDEPEASEVEPSGSEESAPSKPAGSAVGAGGAASH